MNHISMLLKSSDVMTVRRAVFAAGSSRVLITPLPRQACMAKIQDWCVGKPETGIDSTVRIDVGVDESHSDDVVCAFLTTVLAGEIECLRTHTPSSQLRH